jgi:methyl-accepting chemotaxis protein
MSRKHEQTTAHQAADVVDEVADGIRSAAHSVRDTASRAADAMGHSYDQAGKFARDSVNHGRAQVRSWESSFDCAVSEHPKAALLLAAAAGAVAFAWWTRK